MNSSGIITMHCVENICARKWLTSWLKFPKLRVAWPSLEWKNHEAVFKRLQVIISFDGMFKIYAPFRNQLWIPKIGLKWWPVTTSRMNSVERTPVQLTINKLKYTNNQIINFVKCHRIHPTYALKSWSNQFPSSSSRRAGIITNIIIKKNKIIVHDLNISW